jgi:uncharacterized hydrophobic protein (TIGR00271 family)
MSIKLISHVEDSQLTALQKRLESISLLTPEFIVLLAGSTVIATFGLFQNSAAVIIGAMIIAPLMRPLVALSLATITADTALLSRAMLTLAAGSLAGLFIAIVMACFLRSLELSPEILGRTHPTLLDLGVALFAGAIGAYCQTNQKLADSLAGVAISVALVPPLSVVGIGLALNEVAIWSGAALLYATNLIGITLAGSLVFLLMGYTPLQQAKKGLAISSAITILLILPLALSMRELVLENQISAKVRMLLKDKTLTFRGVQLREVEVKRFRTPTRVNATVIASNWPISSHQVKLVQDFLVKEIGTPIEFRLRIIPSQELSVSDVSPDAVQGQGSTQAPSITPADTVLPESATAVPAKVERATESGVGE